MFTRLVPIGVLVASRPHCQLFARASKQIAVPAEPFKKPDVMRWGIRGGGHDPNTTPEYWIDWSANGRCSESSALGKSLDHHNWGVS